MKTPEQHAAELSGNQINYILSFYGEASTYGSPRGLVARGLLSYTWGNDPSMGYVKTNLGLKVFRILKKETEAFASPS